MFAIEYLSFDELCNLIISPDFSKTKFFISLKL